jgi:hypothetical protein
MEYGAESKTVFEQDFDDGYVELGNNGTNFWVSIPQFLGNFPELLFVRWIIVCARNSQHEAL